MTELRSSPPRWALILAFGLVYVAWGTTYLAIKAGVRTLPPGLFGGLRILSAGLLLMGYLAVRGMSLRLAWRDALVIGAAGVLLFVGGNGLLTVAEKSVDSGVASVLVSTTPLLIALGETAWPWGERLTARGWVGLLAGLGGVLVLLGPRIGTAGGLAADAGLFLVLGSATLWSLGSVVLRHGRARVSHLVSAAYQMVLGGAGLTLVGLVLGEAGRLTRDSFTPTAVYAFFHLLVVGSLVGFLAYTWLLQHVSATLAGTYAYVNPVVAVLVGWLLGGETISWRTLVALGVILLGVTLVRAGTGRSVAARGPVQAEATGEQTAVLAAESCE